jgi:hypothetical protein
MLYGVGRGRLDDKLNSTETWKTLDRKEIKQTEAIMMHKPRKAARSLTRRSR